MTLCGSNNMKSVSARVFVGSIFGHKNKIIQFESFNYINELTNGRIAR